LRNTKTGGSRRHGFVYSLDTGRLMGGPIDFLGDHAVAVGLRGEVARRIHGVGLPVDGGNLSCFGGLVILALNSPL